MPSNPDRDDEFRARLDEVERRLAHLSGRDPAAAGDATLGRSAEEAGWVALSSRVERLARLLGRRERRQAEIVERIDGHAEVLRMMCTAMRRLDAPYGCGSSLDEAIGIDGLCGEGDPS